MWLAFFPDEAAPVITIDAQHRTLCIVGKGGGGFSRADGKSGRWEGLYLLVAADRPEHAGSGGARQMQCRTVDGSSIR